MALSGDIESFPLSEVLRLAARSKQSGLLRVESGGTHGRVYFKDGFLTYATTREQDDLGGDLTQRGLIDPHKWYPVERGEEPIAAALVEGKTESDVRSFLAERVADVLVRLLRSRHGRFDFSEHADPQYLTDQRFEIDDVLRGVEARVTEWADIEAVIPVEDATIHLARDLGGRDEVRIDGDTWRIIAALGSSSTVDQVADSTGLSDFMVARTMADLVKQGLLQVRLAVDDRPITEPAVRPILEHTGESITVAPKPTPSLLDRAIAADELAGPSSDESGGVGFFGRTDDASGTDDR